MLNAGRNQAVALLLGIGLVAGFVDVRGGARVVAQAPVAASATPVATATVPPARSGSLLFQCRPGGEASGVLRVVFDPGTPADERAAAHHAAEATPDSEQTFGDGTVAVTVTVPPGTEEAALQAYRSHPRVQSAMGVVISPPVCSAPSPPTGTVQAPSEPVRAPIPGTAVAPPGGQVIFSEPAPPPFPFHLTVGVTNRSAYPAIVRYDQRTLTIEADTGLIVQFVPASATQFHRCAAPVGMPNIVRCENVFAEPPTYVTFTVMSDSAGGPIEAALDLAPDRRPCIPESELHQCDSYRHALWNGEAAAWAERGVTDPDARFNETVVFRVSTGDPVTIAGIARIIGAPYLKVTRVRFVDDEFVEVTNLGGSPQDLTGWTLRSPLRSGVFALPTGVILQPGDRCALYTGLPRTNPGGDCRVYTGIRDNPPGGWWPDDEGVVALFYDALALPGDETRYNADPAHQPPPPNLQLAW